MTCFLLFVSTPMALAEEGFANDLSKAEFIEAAQYVANEYFSTLNMLEYCNEHIERHYSKDSIKLYEEVNRPIIDDLLEPFLLFLHELGYNDADRQNYYGFLRESALPATTKARKMFWKEGDSRNRLSRVCRNLQLSIGEEPFTEFRALKARTAVMESYE